MFKANPKKMKKINSGLVIIFILMNFVVHAQSKQTFWINGIVGLNNHWILNQNAYGNPEMDYSITLSPSGGVGLQYFISDKWGLSSSFQLIKLGQNYSGMQAGGNAERKVKLTYFDVPLSLMRNLPFTYNPTWISFGPDIMLLLDAQQLYTNDKAQALPYGERLAAGGIQDRINPVDLAIDFSVNKMYPINHSGKMMMLLTINSALGLTDINKPRWQTPNNLGVYSKSQNFYIGIKAGIMFKIKQLRGKYYQ